MTAANKPIGNRGSWLAKYEGESIPCVHSHWTNGLKYDDNGLYPDKPKDRNFVARIRATEKVILTTGKVDQVFDRGAKIYRTGYVSMWRVGNIVFDDVNGLRFDFVEKLADFTS